MEIRGWGCKGVQFGMSRVWIEASGLYMSSVMKKCSASVSDLLVQVAACTW